MNFDDHCQLFQDRECRMWLRYFWGYQSANIKIVYTCKVNYINIP